MFTPISKILKSISNDSESLIADRYKLRYLLGKGAMGEVYLAEDTSQNNAQVAIKFLSKSALDQKMITRFENEARVSALLGEQSNHIVKVKDYGLKDGSIPFYVMENLKGSTLNKIIKYNTLSLTRFLDLIRQICLGLECAHNGILVDGQLAPIIHRDIKPSNIFVTKQKESNLEETAKILDFGIAKVINPEESGTQTFMGTLEYCSPEQMAEKKLDHRSDLYSLGIIMYQMLTGEMPITVDHHGFKEWHDAHHYKQVKPLPRYLNLPEDLQKIVLKCLEKSPYKRPENAGEILKTINFLLRKNKSISKTNSYDQKSTISNLLSIKDVCLKSSWPSDKPQRKIVFPLSINSQEGPFASLWTMLEAEEISQFNPQSTFCYSHFLFQSSPHPMLLWINLLYVKNYEPKWLPSYLDLKTELGYQILTNLTKNKTYYVLLFDINKPEKCQEILMGELSNEKREHLYNYLQKSGSWKGEKQPQISKRKLKEKFERAKDTILFAIEIAINKSKSK